MPAWLASLLDGNPYWAVAGVALGYVLGQAPKVAAHWERAVLFRLGRYAGLRGPGLFWIVPFIETIPAWIDQRVVTTGFAAEQTLTADTVPVNVDAVLFWMVHDPEKAALEVQSYRNAVSWAAQTALRDIIGRTSLSESAARARANRRRAAADHRRCAPTRGARPCNRSTCATS